MQGMADLAGVQVRQATSHVQGDVLASAEPAKLPSPVIGYCLAQVSTLQSIPISAAEG